jgi:NAD-dependent SIR2 family protein deacetylase
VDRDLQTLRAFLQAGRPLVLTGAGISTDSGIPDYRGPGSKERNPMRYQTFVKSEPDRRRYWARSMVGWPLTDRAQPNDAHRALARLERAGRTGGVLTQNVDGLHQAAGSRHVLELHGNLSCTVCLSCGLRGRRADLQERMKHANPGFDAVTDDVAPDGDVEIDDRYAERFRVPPCPACGGTLKPDVVFFGENVPAPRVDRAWGMLEAADSLLVLGSSLTVFSGYRFVRKARQLGKPVAICNDGPTRGDSDADVRLHARLTPLLSRVVAHETAAPAEAARAAR